MNQFDYANKQLSKNGTMCRVKNDVQQADHWDLKPKMIELI